MANIRRYLSPRDYRSLIPYHEPTPFRQIQQCFVRKGHTCGKYLGASKSCFIACPSDEDIKILTGLISEKLTKYGIEPVVAIDIRAYGQDIFCTKICGKIIEAQFCIAILDDAVIKHKPQNLNIPNPNVYYEYGLMTALGKYVIPLQKERQELAFNIKTHDTIRYSSGDVSSEIDKALKAAISTTIEERESQTSEIIPEYMFRSFLAVKGYQRQGYSWLLSDDIEGTIFSGYKNDKTLDYLFFAVIDSKDLLKTCLIDIQVIQRRLNSDCETLSDKILALDQKIEECQSRIAQAAKETEKKQTSDTIEEMTRRILGRFDPVQEMETAKTKKREESDKLESIKSSKFGVVLSPDLDQLKDKCVSELDSIDAGPTKFPVYFGDTSGIKIADIQINFTGPEL